MVLTRSQFLKGAVAGAAALTLGRARPAEAKEWTTIRFATEGAYPPYNMHQPDGTLIGYEPDIVAELSKRLGVKCPMQAQAWDGIIPGLQDGKYDAIIDGMSITPKREEVIAFSTPYASSPTTFAVMKDTLAGLPGAGERVKLDDEAATSTAVAALAKALKGKTVGVQTATIQLDFLTKYLKDAVTIRTYATGPESFLDLGNGRIDAVLASINNINPFLEKSKGAMIATGYGFTGGPLGKGSAIGLRKSDPELKALLDKGLAEMAADGTLAKLSVKWFKTDITPRT